MFVFVCAWHVVRFCTCGCYVDVGLSVVEGGEVGVGGE